MQLFVFETINWTISVFWTGKQTSTSQYFKGYFRPFAKMTTLSDENILDTLAVKRNDSQ